MADVINRLLQNLALKCAKSEGIRDYFHVGVVGYGGRAAPCFGGTLAGRGLVPISAVANNPLRVEQRTRKVDDGAGGLIEQKFKFPVWFEPTAQGKTPMCEALTAAHQLLSEFLGRFPACYPPLVINITDGAATDGNPETAAAKLHTLTSSDGNVLLFNAHVSAKALRPIEYPDREDGLPDDYAKSLFRMSSLLPAKLQGAAKAEGFVVTPQSRGFVFNADLVAVIRFLDIGTKVAAAFVEAPMTTSVPMRCQSFRLAEARQRAPKSTRTPSPAPPSWGVSPWRTAPRKARSPASGPDIWSRPSFAAEADAEAGWLGPPRRRWAAEVEFPAAAVVRRGETRAGGLRHLPRSGLPCFGTPKTWALVRCGNRRQLPFSHASRPAAPVLSTDSLGGVRQLPEVGWLAPRRRRMRGEVRTSRWPLASRRPISAHDGCPGPVVIEAERAGIGAHGRSCLRFWPSPIRRRHSPAGPKNAGASTA